MKKIQYLDGLRGLAAFIVVIHHFILAFYPALFLGSGVQNHLGGKTENFMSGSFFNILYSGNFAVCIFFVMSGFVLSHKFFQQKSRKIITESAFKRYIRLVVPVAFSVFCAFLLMSFSLFYNQQASSLSGSYWLGSFWQFAPNFLDASKQTFIGAFFLNSFNYNVTLWTIAFEFVGSFLVFGFMFVFGKMKHRWLAYLAAIIIFFQGYYLAFILGMLLSDIVAHKKELFGKFDKYKIIRTVLLLSGLFLGSYPTGRGVDGTMYASMEKAYLVNSGVLYHILGAFLIMIVMLDSKRMQKMFSSRYLLFLGEISFAVYLLHFIVLGSLASFIFSKLVLQLPYAIASLITFVIYLIFIIGISYLVYVYIDKKAVHWSKLLYNIISKKINF